MKTVVVTGSTRGIGLGLAENFLKRGCKVVVSGRNQVAVDHIVGRLAEEHGADNVAGAACEISDADSVQGLWDAAAAAFGSVDVWINNAGVSSARVNLKDADPADISSVININLAGLLLANRVALRGMTEQGSGQIWNMEGFGSGGQAQPGMAIYGSTKRAVNYLNKALQKELGDSGVQVCTPESPNSFCNALLR